MIVRKITGDGSQTNFTKAHGIGSKPVVYAYKNTSPYKEINLSHEHKDGNGNQSSSDVTFYFNEAPSDGEEIILLFFKPTATGSITGDGNKTSFNDKHGFGRRAIVYYFRDQSPWDGIRIYHEHSNKNEIVSKFNIAPSDNFQISYL